MYDYKITSDVADAVTQISNNEKKKKKADELISQLLKVNDKFKVDNVEIEKPEINLEKMSFENKSKEEIDNEAKTSLQDFKNTSIKNIEDENKSKQDTLISNKETLKESVDEDKNKLTTYYENAKQNTSDDALKRGLARSSIVVNQLNAFDKDQIDKFSALDKELSEKIDVINFEISGLSGQLDKALNDFDITYAVKLQDKINSLNEELSKKELEVKKYNNEIELKEAEFNKEYQELQQKINDSNFDKQLDIANIYGKYGSGVVNKVIEEDLYNTTKAYFNGLDQEEIAAILNMDTVKNALGKVYNSLAKEYGIKV